MYEGGAAQTNRGLLVDEISDSYLLELTAPKYSKRPKLVKKCQLNQEIGDEHWNIHHGNSIRFGVRLKNKSKNELYGEEIAGVRSRRILPSMY